MSLMINSSKDSCQSCEKVSKYAYIASTYNCSHVEIASKPINDKSMLERFTQQWSNSQAVANLTRISNSHIIGQHAVNSINNRRQWSLHEFNSFAKKGI